MNVIKYDNNRQHFAKILLKSKKHAQKTLIVNTMVDWPN